MMRSRIVPVALLCACLAGLAACSDKDTASAAPVAGATSAAPSASVVAAAPSASVAAGGKVTGDKELCDTVSKAGSAMKEGIMTAQKQDGHVEVTDARHSFVTFHNTINEALAFTEATDVTVAARAIADEVGKAATAADPISAAAGAGFDQLSSKLTTACKAAGVTVNF
ncbi:hypothetical protein [Actinoplanes sp. HUAS TT8]|uniref:hypothetical protein n=1 Tax=Actinoplanes sp. HUAS TT8 TaxID=3447453 RepID=UPI003F51F571